MTKRNGTTGTADTTPGPSKPFNGLPLEGLLKPQPAPHRRVVTAAPPPPRAPAPRTEPVPLPPRPAPVDNTIIDAGSLTWLAYRRDDGYVVWTVWADPGGHTVLKGGTALNAAAAKRDLTTAIYEHLTKHRRQ